MTMATTTITQTTSAPSGSKRLFSKSAPSSFGDFRDDLIRDGFVVVKGAIPKEKAEQYADQMLTWCEDFGLGFDRSDPKTISEKHLPVINEKGMCQGYGVAHEQFTWDVRCEAGVVDAFEKVWDTEDIIVSFDAVNIGFPNRKDLPENNPWPHQDQDPEKPGFRCLQGLVNLLPNGPDDGGLIVCKGGHAFSEEFHEEFKNEPNPVYRWTTEWYGFTEQGLKWLADKGCKWEKVCMEPGDLVLWDSRTPHYNLSSTTDQTRLAVYTCFMPVAETTSEDLERKKKAFEEFKCTTHWPNAVQVGRRPVMRDGKPDPYNFEVPKSGKPQLSERGWKLTGIPYLAAAGV